MTSSEQKLSEQTSNRVFVGGVGCCPSLSNNIVDDNKNGGHSTLLTMMDDDGCDQEKKTNHPQPSLKTNNTIDLCQYVQDLSTGLNHLALTLTNNCHLQLEMETFKEIEMFYSSHIRNKWKHNNQDECSKFLYQILAEINDLEKMFANRKIQLQFGREYLNGVDGGDSGQTNQKLEQNQTMIRCHHYWQFWYWKPDFRLSFFRWKDGLLKLAKPICPISENDEHNLQRLRTLIKQELLPVYDVVTASDYAIFQEPIQPTWEDSTNRNGGCWTFEFKRRNINSEIIQKIWERIVEFIIVRHCQMKHFQHVCGIKINMRFQAYLVSIWLDTYVDLSAIIEIGIEIRNLIEEIYRENRSKNGLNRLNIDPTFPKSKPFMVFQAHKVSIRNALTKDQEKYGDFNWN